jgi:hypothetical protein
LKHTAVSARLAIELTEALIADNPPHCVDLQVLDDTTRAAGQNRLGERKKWASAT